jgi:inhibitor of KinA sporulation pathway (predicted exonuclease)
MDFEATCDKDNRQWPNEVIEFPAVLIDAATLQTVDEFQRFVRPTENPQLTDFCTELTSITQEQVDGAETLDTVLAEFDQWLLSHGISEQAHALPVFCGDWDLNKCLPVECRRKRMRQCLHPVLRHWCNVKIPFTMRTRMKQGGMEAMLEHLHLRLDGTHHRGIDDSRNIAKILVKLIQLDQPITATQQRDGPAYRSS